MTELERDVVTLVAIASPLPLSVIQSTLETSDEEASSIVDALRERGVVAVDRLGVSTNRELEGGARESMLATRLLRYLDASDAPAALKARAAWVAGESQRSLVEYRAAIDAGSGDMHSLLDRAIEASEDVGVDDAGVADLLMRRAMSARNRGESDAALADLNRSIPHLSGSDAVDALAFAGAVEDDRQHPADAERYVAMGMLVAAQAGLLDKLGSLSTLHGRVLSRVGFEREADDAFSRGLALVELHGDHTQAFYASLNEALMAFDRGWMAKAEQRYAVAQQRASQIESSVSAADKEIALARARFGSGDPQAALEGLERARVVAEETDAPALRFLAAIADIEGALTYRRLDSARDSLEDLRAIVDASFPVWVNRLATLQARVALLADDRAAAREAVAMGLEATPHGANGSRLRAELEALDMVAADSWDERKAGQLGDRILQSGWLGLAAWFMTVRAERDNDSEVAMVAAGLAHRLGNPMQAAHAVDTANGWDDPRAGAVALAVERVSRNVPAEWAADFSAIPFVPPALERAGVTETAADSDLVAGLDAALRAAGLSGDSVLSPAQRRAAGLVIAPSKARTVFRWLAPLVGAAAVAAVVAIVFAPDPPEAAVVLPPVEIVVPTTALPEIGRRVVPPDGDLFGQSPYGGGDERNPVYDVELGEPIGIYWRQPLTGFALHDPVLQGKAVYVGTNIGRVYAFDVANEGSLIFDDDAGEIVSAFVVDQVTFDQGGQSRSFVFYGDDDGVLWMRNIDDGRGVAWSAQLDSPITGPPLIRGDHLLVATRGGVLYSLLGSTGEVIARTPEEDSTEEQAGFVGAMAAADGILYVRTSDGRILLVDEETFVVQCEAAGRVGAARTDPLIAGDKWFIGTATTAVFAFNKGTCSSVNEQPAYQIDTPIDFSAPVADGVMWNAADGLMVALNVADGQFAFTSVNLEGSVTSPPIVAGDLALVGVVSAGNHELVAVSRLDGTVRWRFPLGRELRTRPVVGDGLIIVATDTEMIAIAAPPG